MPPEPTTVATSPQIEPDRSTEADAAPSRQPRNVRRLWRRAASGFVLGSLLGMGLIGLRLDSLIAGGDRSLRSCLVPVCAAAGMLLGLTRARVVLHWAAAATVTLFFVVGITPLVPHLTGWLERSDPLQSAPAVVMLGTTWEYDGSHSADSQDRALKAYEILRRGYARRLVLTRGPAQSTSWVPLVRKDLELFGLEKTPIDEVGPVIDTHDEALAVAGLMRERGWDRVILVTHPAHMRRAAAVFESAGVRVICAPCHVSGYDWKSLPAVNDRTHAFSDWLHEVIGYQAYRMRGWIR